MCQLRRITHKLNIRSFGLYSVCNYENTPIHILQPKKEKIQIKNSDIFQISSQNIDCGLSLEPPRRGGSNEYPQSMFF